MNLYICFFFTLKLAFHSVSTLFRSAIHCSIMPGIFRKCPYCGEDAILKTIEPDFRKGVFRRIFECRNGHEFSEESGFEEEKKWVKEVFSELAEEFMRKT